MDGLNLALFLAAAFFGGLTSGVSGFAMGLVVSGVWLHLISPDQNALLIVLCGLVTQGSGIWRVRHAVNWRTVTPFIIGGAVGVPAGTALLTSVDQNTLRLTIGVLLVLYSLYNLIRPAVKPVQGGVTADVGVGVANGLIGGLTGLGGIAVTIWCQLRGGPKDAQRAIFQPVNVCDLCHERDLSRGSPRIHRRDVKTLCARAACTDCRRMVWAQPLWKAQ
jgi:uncharacterized membrane protein YfcA